jgi:hypothetical protein
VDEEDEGSAEDGLEEQERIGTRAEQTLAQSHQVDVDGRAVVGVLAGELLTALRPQGRVEEVAPPDVAVRQEEIAGRHPPAVPPEDVHVPGGAADLPRLRAREPRLTRGA